MLPAQSVDGARNLLSTLSSLVVEESKAQDLYRSVLKGHWVHEVMVTNYAFLPASGSSGGTTLTLLDLRKHNTTAHAANGTMLAIFAQPLEKV